MPAELLNNFCLFIPLAYMQTERIEKPLKLVLKVGGGDTPSASPNAYISSPAQESEGSVAESDTHSGRKHKKKKKKRSKDKHKHHHGHHHHEHHHEHHHHEHHHEHQHEHPSEQLDKKVTL